MDVTRWQLASPSRRRNVTGYFFLFPALILLAVFTIVPFGQGILLSFQSWDGISPDASFVGLENYRTALQDEVFLSSLKNAVIFGLAGFFIGNGVSLGMAIAVNAVTRGRTFFRTIFYLPGTFSVIVVGMMFSWLLAPGHGPINRALGAVGLDHNWLGDPLTALPAVAAVFIWYHWGFAFILFLAGLQDVPRELYEAASIDGAGRWAKFRFVTWPNLAPVTTIVSLLTMLAALQIFGTVQVLTNGGPGYHTQVPTLVIYAEAFQNFRYGPAAAMSILFGGALVLVAAFQLWFSGRRAG